MSFRILLLSLLCICLAGGADGAVVVDIDLSTTDASVGTPISASLTIELEAGDSLSAYGFSLRFDTDEFDVSNFTSTPPNNFFPSPSGFDEDTGMIDPTVGKYGEITFVNGINLFGSVSGPSTFTVGTFAITPTSVSPGGADIDFVLGEFDPNDGFGDAGSAPFTPTFGTASIQVTAVPEPSSMAVVAIMFAAVVGPRRRKRLALQA